MKLVDIFTNDIIIIIVTVIIIIITRELSKLKDSQFLSFVFLKT